MKIVKKVEVEIFCANSFDPPQDYCVRCGKNVTKDWDYYVLCIPYFMCWTICGDCYEKLISAIAKSEKEGMICGGGVEGNE